MLLKFRPRTKAPAAALQGDGAMDAVDTPGVEMSFLEHLEELRWAIIKGLAGVILTTLLASIFSEWIVNELLMGPARSDFFVYRLLGIEAETLDLQNRTITGQFFAHIGIVIAVGIVLGSPIFVYFLWRFIEPGLYSHERQGLRFASFFATFFFMLGIAFGYCVICPMALQFFANYKISELIANEFDITKYFGMITWWSFGAGLLFEMPVVIYVLAMMGIATPVRLRQWRKYALLGSLILGAIFTPPDPISQILVATPLMLLYEGSIVISGVIERKRNRLLQKEMEREAQEKAAHAQTEL